MRTTRTSREYIEFLRDQIKGTASTLPAAAYLIQTDPFFSQGCNCMVDGVDGVDGEKEIGGSSTLFWTLLLGLLLLKRRRETR